MFVASFVSGASPPLRASSPKARIVLGASIVGGLLLGIAIGMLGDLMDRGARASWEAWKGLQLACIVAVPVVTSGDSWRKLTAVFSGPAQKRPMKSAGRNIVRTASPIWAIADAPQSRFTELLLEIKRAIDTMNRSGERNRVIGITSAQPGEGKSTVAAAWRCLWPRLGLE